MRRTVLASVVMLAVTFALSVTAACDDDDDDDECCPISPAPQCTDFKVGGAKSLNGGYCSGGMTDNLPSIITKKTDAKGCPYWELDQSSPRTCGVAPPKPTGSDGGDAGDAGDAGDDGDVSVDAGDAG